MSRRIWLARKGNAKRRGRGQSLVEFALAFPIIVLFIAGFIEIGRAVYAYNVIANAARQGARVAAVNQIDLPTECEQSRPIEDPSYSYWSIKGCTLTAAKTLGIAVDDVDVSYATPPNTTLSCSPTLHIGCLATVTVTYNYSVATPFVNLLIGPITMTQTSQMPIERVFP